MIRDRLDRRLELRRLRGEAGHHGAIRTPALTPASRSVRTARSRCSGWAVPGSSARHASSSTVGTLRQTVQPADARQLGEQVRVAHDHRTLGDDARPACAPRSALPACGASACSALRSADTDPSRCRAPPARASTTACRAPAAGPRRNSPSRRSATRTRRPARARTASGSGARSSSGSRACSRDRDSASSRTASP